MVPLLYKLGRDVLLQTLKGVRVALLIGGLSSLLVIPIALGSGMSAGYFGRRADDAVFFIISTLSSIPPLLLLIALVMALGRGTLQVCVALGVTSWVGLSRVNEFQEIPKKGDQQDWDKFETTLKEHKASAFFNDRTDIEVAGESTSQAPVEYQDIIHAMDVAVKVGFVDVGLTDPAGLAARPSL